MAAVAWAAPSVEVEGDRPVAAAVFVFSGTPDVKGMSLTELAPEKAASWVLAVGLAVAEGLSGLRTLTMLAGFVKADGMTYASMTWTTPLAMRTSGTMTLASLTQTVPLWITMLSFSPSEVVREPFLRVEL